jgi:DNA-binding beta-propeller fold protein YncE
VTTRRSFLIAGTAALAACKPKRSHGYEGYAFVANEEGRAIAAVDLTAFAVVRHVPLNGRPTAVIAPEQGTSVYALTPENGTVHAIATGRLELARSIRIAPTALAMRYDRDANCLWILTAKPAKLVRLPLDSFRAGAEISLPADPVDYDLSQDGKLAAVSFGDEGSCAVVSLADKRIERRIRVDSAIGTIRFRSDDRCLLVANRGRNMLSIYDTATGRVVTHLPLAVRPDHFCFRSDGGQMFITGKGMDSVVVVYPHKTPMVAETVLAGSAPGAMCASAGNPDFLFVMNPESGNVTVLDIVTRRVVGIVSAGAGPGYATVTPDGQYALVLNHRSGDMAVIRIAAITGKRTKFAPLFTMIPVGSGPVSAAVKSI